MDVSTSGAWHTKPWSTESTESKTVVNPVTADVVLLTVACLVKIPELIESKAAPESVPMDADASVARPVTPNVPEHEAFAREVRPVTPSVPPIVQAFVTPREFNVAAAVVVRVAEEVDPLTAREVAAAAPRFPRLRTLEAESAKGSVAVNLGA